MNKQIKRFCATVIMALAVYCLCSTFSYALVAFNWRECASASVCTSQIQTVTPTLKTYVVKSTGDFLISHSAYQSFLNRVEMSETSGIDYNELRETLYIAIENMEKAKAAYTNLKTASEKMPYNQEMIDQLIIFDYDGFRIKYGLIEPIFAKIKTLLGKGDIAGFDVAVLANMDTILIKLYEIKAVVDKDQMPEIALLWRANQAYVEAQLFGQYMSEIFKNILF